MLMEKITGFIMTAGHLDIEWYQPLNSYRFWTVEALEDLKEAAKRSDFKTYVLDGQVFPLEEYLEVVPEDECEMRELICSGKLAIGPFYTQFDEWIPSAENMIRNCLYGKRKAEQFGGYMRAGYLPDNFGHPLQMPQILNNFGIDSLLFMRGMPEIPGGHPDEFLYRGIDGTEVLVSHFRESYSGAFDIFDKDNDPIQPREVPYYGEYLSYEYHRELAWHDDPERIAKNLIANVHKIKNRYPSDIIALIAGYDHLPPQINIGESVKKANELQDQIQFIMGTAEDYVRLVQGQIRQPAVYSMELTGSRYQSILLGALSTRTYLKRQNFACEALLERYAEPLDAIASCWNYPDKPALLDEAWKYMMINSAHDSIHGSSTDEVHVEMEARFAKTRQIAAGVIHDAMAFLGQHTVRWWESLQSVPELQRPVAGIFAKNDGHMHRILPKGLLAYAPVSADFAQPSELWLPIGDHPCCICDREGTHYPTQVLDREDAERNGKGEVRNSLFPDPIYRKVLFLHPYQASGVDTLAAVPGIGSEYEPLQAGDDFLENEYLRVQVTGSCIQITDKPGQKTYYNLNLLEEEADAGDAWDFSPPWVPGKVIRSSSFPFTSRLAEQGPVRGVLEVSGTMRVPAGLKGDIRLAQEVDLPVSYRITVWRGIKRADVKLTIDNTAKDHRIRLRIPAGLKTDHVLSQQHLAVLKRPIERPAASEAWYQPPTRLLPFREWIAVEDGTHGMAVAFKGMYDYEAVMNPLSQEPDLYVTLVRGFEKMGRIHMMQREWPASEAIETPGAQCLGIQEMEWSYIPYETSETDTAPFLPLAQSFLYPPVIHAVRSRSKTESFDSLPPAFGWDEENIQFSAYKQCHDRDGYMLRFFENQGKRTRADIRIGSFQKACLSNMNEETLEELDVSDGSVVIDIAPYQAVSLKLTSHERR